MQGADLTGGCLSGAFLAGADLQGAHLQGADLSVWPLPSSGISGPSAADLTGRKSTDPGGCSGARDAAEEAMMKRFWHVVLILVPVWLAAGAPGHAAAANLPPVELTYRGGALIQSPQVSILFWGPEWQGQRLTDYLASVFPAVFRDGRFMKNLEQYSAGGYQISNGKYVATKIDEVSPPPTVRDAQIRAELRAQIDAGQLPAPTPDSIYFVFVQKGTEVVDPWGSSTKDGMWAYHYYTRGKDTFAYAVVPYDEGVSDPARMSMQATAMLAATVTDPNPTGRWTLGWYDDNYGEVDTIVMALWAAQQIGPSDTGEQFWDVYGMPYIVAKVWSNVDNRPVALAPVTRP